MKEIRLFYEYQQTISAIDVERKKPQNNSENIEEQSGRTDTA